jgi:hypothetical protein
LLGRGEQIWIFVKDFSQNRERSEWNVFRCLSPQILGTKTFALLFQLKFSFIDALFQGNNEPTHQPTNQQTNQQTQKDPRIKFWPVILGVVADKREIEKRVVGTFSVEKQTSMNFSRWRKHSVVDISDSDCVVGLEKEYFSKEALLNGKRLTRQILIPKFQRDQILHHLTTYHRHHPT